MIGFGISTRDRRELALKCLQAVHSYANPDDLIIVCDDASSDGTLFAMADWNFDNTSNRDAHVELLQNPGQLGVAGTKFRIVERLLQGNPEHIILIEDDVMPLSEGWAMSMIGTATANQQAHLLYLPTEWKYGSTFAKTIPDNQSYSIEWKQMCSGMIMYFRTALLREVGNFDKKFGLFGYEHNELTSRCLVAQGLHPERYPHCTVLETQNLVMAQDVINTRPRMAYHENAAYNKEMDKKAQTAYGNRPYYLQMMQPLRAKFAGLSDPGAAHYREKFFSLAKTKS